MGGIYAKGSARCRTVQLTWEGSHKLHLSWKPDRGSAAPNFGESCTLVGSDRAIRCPQSAYPHEGGGGAVRRARPSVTRSGNLIKWLGPLITMTAQKREGPASREKSLPRTHTDCPEERVPPHEREGLASAAKGPPQDGGACLGTHNDCPEERDLPQEREGLASICTMTA